MIIERIKLGLKKRKVKVFLVILLFSTLAWLINNLSQIYNSTTSFEMEYVNIPDELLLTNVPKQNVQVKLKAVGFQFLGFGLRKKKVQIDLSVLNRKDSSYYIAPEVYRKQIEGQLPSTITLLELDRDTIFLELDDLITKEVPVIPRINFNLVTNFMLEDTIAITPPTVKITGPKNEVDTITGVRTVHFDLLGVDEDFFRNIELTKPRELKTTVLSPNTVSISGKVFRFSERALEVSVSVINVPDGIKVRTFPDKVRVLCQGKLERIKNVEPDDFKVIADYQKVFGTENNMMPLRLENLPNGVNNATLPVNEIEFLLRRE